MSFRSRVLRPGRQYAYARLPVWLLSIYGNFSRKFSGIPYKTSANEAYFAQLQESEGWSRSQLEALQSEKLQRVARHAYENIPYYSRTWREIGITPDDLKKTEDLQKLPVMTREEVIAHADELLDPKLDKSTLYLSPTGGSTGAPMRTYLDPYATASRMSCFLRWKTRGGCDLFEDRFAFIARPSLELMQSKRLWGERGEKYKGAYDPRMRCLRLACTNLYPGVLAGYLDRMRKIGVTYVHGYTSAVHQLAQYFVERGVTLPLKAAFTSSESLFDDTRDVVRKAFQCEVWDHYSSNEFVLCATECCKHNGYHVHMEQCIAEVVDKDGHRVFDQIGLVCGTSLDNMAMPLFRYCLNDEASMTKQFCACGLEHVMFDRLIGRVNDYILTPNGFRITAPPVRMALLDLDCIREYQLIQEDDEEVKVLISPGKDWDDSVLQLVEDRFGDVLGRMMRVKAVKVDIIPRPSSGKFRIIVNKMLTRENKHN